MAQRVHKQVQDGVAVLTLDRPPGNALTPALRAELLNEFEAACADAGVGAIVLAGAGSGFCSGMDLTDFDAPPAEPSVGALCRAIEEAPKPVVAAVHGAALGAGAELVLAAHARVARRGARLALPEVTLGLIPGGGATQRLPRLVGAQAALDLMLSGRAADVSEARLPGLFDRIVEDEPIAAAADLARDLAAQGTWTRTRDREHGPAGPVTHPPRTAGRTAQGAAGAAIAACVEAAQLLPFDQGLAFEETRFLDRIAAPEARAIRHVFAAERRAAALPGAGAGSAERIATVAVLGSGPSAADLAYLGLSLGLSVRVLSVDNSGGETLLARVRDRLDRAVQAGRIDRLARDRRLSRLATLRDPSGLASADLVLDTGRPAAERPLPLKDGAIWALANDIVPAEERAREVGAEGRLLRLRLHRPTPAGQLVELAVPADLPAGDAAAVVRAFSVGGCSVVAAAGDGYLGDGLLSALCAASLLMLAGGVTAAGIETAARELGLARGPLRMIDEAGALATLARARRTLEARQVPLRPLRLLSDRIADAGADPARALAFHRPSGQALEPDPDLAAWLAEWRADNPQRAVAWPDVSPAAALQAALVNEAARLIETRAAARPSDIDLVMVKGFGFDRERGGPLLRANLDGLLGPVRAMARLRKVSAPLWAPRPLLTEMVKNGRRFF